MEKRKNRDNLISCLLVLTLMAGVFLVSCSEDDGFLTGVNNTNGIDPVLTSPETSTISQLFLSVGKGAASSVGGDMTGWVLGAMGLSASSGPNYQQQINEILNELQAINTTLNNINTELISINQTIANMNCDAEQTSLQSEIGSIKSAYQDYQGYVSTSAGGDTLPISILKGWADRVLNGNASFIALQAAVNNMTASLESTGGPIIACIQVLPGTYPEGALNIDTGYYNMVDYFTNYYYYYQTLALMMISEAHHFYAWYEAGQPGGTYTSSDSIQKVCTDNPTSQYHCNNVGIQTNDLYNQIIKQMTDGGAGYSGEHLVFQYSATKPLVWVNSLEGFTSITGSNCHSPLSNTNLCGPTVGYYYSELGITTYQDAVGFRFANSSDLAFLIDVDKAKNYTSNGKYLEANGFYHMEKKTVISTDSVWMQLPKSNHHTPVVPFFNTDIPPVINYGDGKLTSVFRTSNDFGWVFYPNQHGTFTCGSWMAQTGKDFYYQYAPSLGTADPWAIAYATVSTCSDGSYTKPFKWRDSTFNNGGFPGEMKYWPGWLTSAQYPNSVKETRRFLWPVLYTQEATCTNGRHPVNSGNMPTKCGDDFTAILKANVPRPPTCDMQNLNTPCVVLN